MRITNKMMTNNMMNNITKNKYNMTKLEQQYSTGKKIQRPSDDPIITVRALKLRTNLSEMEQYTEKNIPDAKSWMDVTEGALTTVNGILKQINTYCVQGSTDTLTAEDRSSISQNLQELKQQIYHEGNINYAGRFVFTGFKTDSSLIFDTKTTNLQYKITESFSGTDIQVASKVTGSYDLADYENTGISFDAAPQMKDYYRLQLAYGNLEDTPITSISYTKTVAGKEVEQTPFTKISSVSLLDDNAYLPNDDTIHFIKETGELIMGKDAYEEFRTANNIKISYDKSTFEQGELKPEHYFDCEVYNTEKPELGTINYEKEKQEIQYEINYNQKLTINTEGKDAFSHQIGRNIEDILARVVEVRETEDKIAEIKKRLQDTSLTETQKGRYEKMLEQLDTELVLRKEIMQTTFSEGITVSNKEQDKVNVAVSDLGSRYVRLELTESRLSVQKTDFEDLLTSNEDADLVDTVIKYNSAETIYNAALSAASKVVKTTLLDFL
ncbi:MAG: hypothetical protein K0S47_773 [Herbinix sp.]|jgi:flagellar hook-associated protein 3 FlgL|nr:hypothetical protein [Herbinix sp.]